MIWATAWWAAADLDQKKPGGKAGCDKRDSDTHFC